MLEQVAQFALYLFVGFIEMFLITQRTSFIAKNKRKMAALVVFVENTITFFVILQLARDISHNLPAFGAYCLGSCTGTIINIDRFLDAF